MSCDIELAIDDDCPVELKVYCEPGLEIEIGAVGPGGPIGPQGPPGATGPKGDTGPQGPSGTSTAITLIAGPRPIGGHKAVRLLNPGTVDLVDASSVVDRNSCIGVTTNAAVSGGSVQVVTSGFVAEPSWSWVPGLDVFLGDTPGQLTQTYNSSRAFSQIVGQAVDANKIVALDATGRLDPTMMPVGIAADTASITASEALSAGDFVNVWNNAGAFNVRKADASTSGKECHGFVLSAFASAASALVYFEGTNTQITGAIAGQRYLSTSTPGGHQATAPTVAGQIVQPLGIAVSATSIKFEPDATTILLA